MYARTHARTHAHSLIHPLTQFLSLDVQSLFRYVSDASAVMVIVLLLFLLPAKVPRVFCLRKEGK